MRPPRVDPETVEIVRGHDDHWIATWQVTPPDQEWLLAFWAAMAQDRKVALVAHTEEEARARFDRMVEQAHSNWSDVANGPDGP